jgi:hypothetical protein
MRLRLAWPAVLVGLTVLACHTITEELPQETPVTPATVPVVNAPVIVIPVPTATPVPTAPSNPSNPTNPAPAPTTTSCPLPPGQNNNNCTMQSQTFLSRVEAAIDEVVATDPQAFNLTRTRGGCANCYQVVDATRYVNRVAQAITKNGVCGFYDGEELGVKNSNQFNDQFDILTSDGYIRRQGGAYRSTCHPAWF